MSARCQCRRASSIPIWRKRSASRSRTALPTDPRNVITPGYGPCALAAGAIGPRRSRNRRRPCQPAIARQIAARRPAGIHSSALNYGRRIGRRGRKNPKAAARLVIKSELRAEGRSAAGHQRIGRRRAPQRPQPGAARRHRLGQDLHHGEGDRGDAAPGADPRAQQDAGGAALRRVQELLSRQRGRVFRLATTTTTSRKRISRAPTPTSRRIPRSTSRSTACAIRRRARCSNATT